MIVNEGVLLDQQAPTLQELTSNLMGKKGAHIIYMFNEQDKYLENAVSYVGEGLDTGDQVLLVERLNNYHAIKDQLIAKGYTKDALNLITYISSDGFYLSENNFDAEKSYKQLEKFILGNLENGSRTRTWGQVLANGSSISEIRRYESICDTFINGKDTISVCTYNALTTPAFFQNELLKVHEYLMLDHVVVKSPFYDRKFVSFSESERERVQNLEWENNLLKRKNEKLLMDKVRQKEREKFLETERTNAEKAIRAKSVFLSQMSHDLRTPLNTIQGYAQILLLSEFNRDYHEKITRMYNASEQLLQLIEEILDFSALDIGNIPINTKEIQLLPFLEECIETLLETQTNIDIQLEKVPEEIFIDADPLRLNQIIMNLLNNAIKYNRPNGTISIFCTHNEKDEVVTINVKDSGLGIASKEKNLIFEPFYRSKTHMKYWKGTGLGLAIVAQLTTRMNGDYGVITSEGSGSTFWVSFKQTKGTNQVVPNNIESRWGPNNHFNVIYIEDNKDNIEVMKVMLDVIGNIELRCATSGNVGLEKIDEQQPDFILLDLSLPDLHGFEVLRKLKANQVTRNIPVIIVSADAMETTIKEACENGAAGYLTKPINLKELRNLFAKL